MGGAGVDVAPSSPHCALGCGVVGKRDGAGVVGKREGAGVGAGVGSGDGAGVVGCRVGAGDVVGTGVGGTDGAGDGCFDVQNSRDEHVQT